jgi:predicted enzyme related to lactoylglutathione lyase
MSETVTEKSPVQATAPSATFGFVKLVVRELEPMLEFYAGVLGLVAAQTIDTPEMTEKILRKPGQETGAGLILYRHKDGREITLGNAYGPVGFYVRDVDASFAHAVAQGAAAHREPWDSGNLRVAFVLDPEGREIELVSVKR